MDQDTRPRRIRRARRGWRTSIGLVATAVMLGACGAGGQEAATTPGPTTSAPPAVTTTSEHPAARSVRVWFLDERHAATGEEPLFRGVLRTVDPPAVARAALDALFAGPTAAERADGLRLVTSGATGYRGLSITDGLARVTLVGGCASGGSTMTIAGEIVPTLTQFATVRHVKIFDPSGATEDPGGSGDSIPACLEP